MLAAAPDYLARAGTGRIVRGLARQGLGIVHMPSILIQDDFKTGRLLRVLPVWTGVPLEGHAVWEAGQGLARRARVFLEFMAPRLTVARD